MDPQSDLSLTIADDHPSRHSRLTRTCLTIEDTQSTTDIHSSQEDSSSLCHHTSSSLSSPISSRASTPPYSPIVKPKLPLLSISLFSLTICLLYLSTVFLDDLFILIQPITHSDFTTPPPTLWNTLPPLTSRQELHYDLIEPEADQASPWTILCLHGLGSINATDAYAIRNQLLSINKDLVSRIRFVIPSAHDMAVDVWGGARTPAWFNIHDWQDLRSLEDQIHMQANVRELHQIVTTLKLDMSRTIFMGFSQGECSCDFVFLLLGGKRQMVYVKIMAHRQRTDRRL